MQNPLSFTSSLDCLSPKGQVSHEDYSNSTYPTTTSQEDHRQSLQCIDLDSNIRNISSSAEVSTFPSSPYNKNHEHTKQLEQREQLRRSSGVLYKLMARENTKSVANLISRSSVNLQGSLGIKRITAKIEDQERNRRLEDHDGAAVSVNNAREVSRCIRLLGWPAFVQGPTFALGQEHFEDGEWCDIPLKSQNSSPAALPSLRRSSNAVMNLRSSSPSVNRQSSPASDRRLSKSLFASSPSSFHPDRFSSPNLCSTIISVETTPCQPEATLSENSTTAPLTPPTKIAQLSSLARVTACAMEDCGSVPTTEWFAPVRPSQRKPAFVHARSHESGLISPNRAVARSFSLKELKEISHSVAKHEKIAEREKQKAAKYEEKAGKLAERGKVARAIEIKREASQHRLEAQKHVEAASSAKAKVAPGSTLAHALTPASIALAGSPVQ